MRVDIQTSVLTVSFMNIFSKMFQTRVLVFTFKYPWQIFDNLEVTLRLKISLEPALKHSLAMIFVLEFIYINQLKLHTKHIFFRLLLEHQIMQYMKQIHLVPLVQIWFISLKMISLTTYNLIMNMEVVPL